MSMRTVCAFAGVAGFACAAHGAIVTVNGDLGSTTVTGTSTSTLAGPATITTNFAISNIFGSVTGDVVATIAAGSFTLALTNLTFAASGTIPLTTIDIVAQHSFQTVAAPTVAAMHGVSGNWSPALSPLNSVQLDTDIFSVPTTSLPMIFAVCNAPSPILAAASGWVNVPNTSSFLTVEMRIRLVLDNIETLHLPSSAELTVNVPAPGAAGLVGLGGVLSFRRRRR